MSKLREELNRRGWNARKLALTLGRNVPYTTKVVKGEAVATRPMIQEIGNALEIDVESFFDERRFAR
ncbi:MAG: hypothetical protein EOM14_16485 [Clostridia bacterium]|nr:hypothetical protein [Clostridia bacterium]